MSLLDSDDLILPDAPDFISESPHYTASEMAALCEKMLPYWNSIRYGSSNKKTDDIQTEIPMEEFILDD